MGRLSDLRDFYGLLEALAGVSAARTMSACSGRLPWPSRGVYFFREVGESRSHSGTGSRIVRVGTHGLKENSQTKLWTRLSQHRGSPSSGRGNHRGSIFRLIVGAALLNRGGLAHATWGVGNNALASVRADEVELEQQVSAHIGQMEIICLAVPDDPGPSSSRGFIERNAIALLSNFRREPLDPPSDLWLGLHCDRERVRNSGLWNSNHVDESVDPRFLTDFEKAIHSMERGQ
jgi:hypothetical protein